MTIDDIDVKTVVAHAATTDSVYDVSVNYTTPDLQDKRPPVSPSDPELVSGDFASRTTFIQLAKKQLNAYFHGKISNVRRSGWYTSESGLGDALNRHAYPAYEGNQIAKDHRNALPMGCEKNIAASTFTVTKVMAAATVTNAWLYARMSQVWTMNNATFRSLAARTTMLTGMQSSQRASGDWDITYNFEFRPYIQMQVESPSLSTSNKDAYQFDSSYDHLTLESGFYNPRRSGTTQNGGDTGAGNLFFPAIGSDFITYPASTQQEYFEFSAWDYFYLKTRQTDMDVKAGDFGDGINAGASGYSSSQKSALAASGFSISRIYDETDFSNFGIGT
jgi:hypothetical protein